MRLNTQVEALARGAAGYGSRVNDLPVKRAVDWKGIPVHVEYDAGDAKDGVSPEGKEWRTEFSIPYGFIPGTLGADGDSIDAYLGPDADADKVHVVSQNHPDGTFDEHKVMLGFKSNEDALTAYNAHHSGATWAFGSMESMPLEDFQGRFMTAERRNAATPQTKRAAALAAGAVAYSGRGR